MALLRSTEVPRGLTPILLPGERLVTAVRAHWGKLAEPVATTLLALAAAVWVDSNVTKATQALGTIFWWLFFGLLLRLIWCLLDWSHNWFVATDKRLLLRYGLISHKVAMMPLLKVTDMTYDRSLLGRIVGYGTFVLESAGRDQALSRIDHVPDADTHYRAICTQLFGPNSQIRFAPGFVAPPPPDGDGPDDDDGGGRGGGGGTSGPDAGGPAPVGASPRRSPAEPSALPTPVSRPESWYRSSNLRAPSHVGDTGEIPVVRVPREAEEQDDSRLYPPPHWVD